MKSSTKAQEQKLCKLIETVSTKMVEKTKKHAGTPR